MIDLSVNSSLAVRGGRTSIHLSEIKQGPQECLADFIKCLHQEAVLIPNLEDEVAYTSFLNNLKSGWFRFSLAEQKETTLAEALRKLADFIRATKICAESTNAPKKAKAPVDRNSGRGDRRPRLEVVDDRYTTDPRSIFTHLGIETAQCAKVL